MLDIMKIREMMDKGYGVSPEIQIYEAHYNHINFRLSKRFKGVLYYQEVSTLIPSLSKLSNTPIQEQVERGVYVLQRSIDRVAQREK